MHLAQIVAENFRIFGAADKARALDLTIAPGLTVLVGANDSGKSAIVDAIRLVLGTSANDARGIREEDFHTFGGVQEKRLRITCRFEFNDWSEAWPFFEHLTPEGGQPVLYLTLSASLQPKTSRRLVTADVRSGKDGSGPRPDATMRQLMAVTYLRALRDALAELSAGRGSRLSRILANHPSFAKQDVDDYNATSVSLGNLPKTLRGIMHFAEDQIESNEVIVNTRQDLNDTYLDPFSVLGDKLIGTIGITKSQLRDVLEKLELWIDAVAGSNARIYRGLGTNNVLFMATELLLLRTDLDDGLPLLCIEEPEAHLHPQMQLLVSDFFEREATRSAAIESGDDSDESKKAKRRLQVIVTTHSPTLASKFGISQLVVVSQGKTFPLTADRTKLSESDYRHLANFLDATRANLFFARAVLVVEGDAENLALPAIFEILGYALPKIGASIVRVGSRGLFRYSRIFQGKEPRWDLPVRVACLADLDLPVPENATPAERDARVFALQEDAGGPVRVFPSDHRTFEYDIAFAGLERPLYRAITLAKLAKSRREPVPPEHRAEVLSRADVELAQLVADASGNRFRLAAAVYAPLEAGSASKAETGQYLAELLREEVRDGLLDAKKLSRVLPTYLLAAADWLVPSFVRPE